MAMEEIRARLGLSTTKFSQGLRKAKLESQAFGKNFKSMLGTSVLGFSLGLLARKIDDFTSRIIDSSRALGISTDFVQAFTHAANENNIKIEASSMALQRFTRRIGEASMGRGELVQTIKEQNIQLRNEDGTMRSTESIMVDYARAVQNADSEQKKLALTFKAFDSEGARLVTIMDDLAEGQDAFIQKAREANAIIEQESLRAIDDLTTRFRLFATKGLVVVSQRLGEFIQGVQYAISFWKELGSTLFESTGGTFSEDMSNKIDGALAVADAATGLTNEQVRQAKLAEQNLATQNSIRDAMQKQAELEIKKNEAIAERSKMKLEEVADFDVRAEINRGFAINRERRDRALALQRSAQNLNERAKAIFETNPEEARRLEALAKRYQKAAEETAATIVNPMGEAAALNARAQQMKKRARELNEEADKLAMGARRGVDPENDMLRARQMKEEARRLKAEADELTSNPVNNFQQLIERQQNARRIQAFEAEARRLEGLGFADKALQMNQRAIDLRGQINALQQGDRDPLHSINDQMKTLNDTVAMLKAGLPADFQAGMTAALNQAANQ